MAGGVEGFCEPLEGVGEYVVGGGDVEGFLAELAPNTIKATSKIPPNTSNDTLPLPVPFGGVGELL